METATTERGEQSATATAPAGCLLLVDKPAGWTSHDVVAVVRRAARTKKVGHTGTLDPFATGLLVVLIGSGTRLIQYVDGEPKVYDAHIRFGAETATDDATGAVTRESAALPTDAEIDAAIRRLTGTLDQVPPAYSAKQIDGRRAYDAARDGAPLTLAPARVVVHSWQVVRRDGADLHARITCGGGTYIRALARDLGRLTHSAAHLAALRRERSGPFDVADAMPVEAIKNGAPLVIAPLRAAVQSLTGRVLSDDERTRVSHGNAIDAGADEGRVALLDAAGALLGIAEREGHQLRPRLVLAHG